MRWKLRAIDYFLLPFVSTNKLRVARVHTLKIVALRGPAAHCVTLFPRDLSRVVSVQEKSWSQPIEKRSGWGPKNCLGFVVSPLWVFSIKLEIFFSRKFRCFSPFIDWNVLLATILNDAVTLARDLAFALQPRDTDILKSARSSLFRVIFL